MAEKTSSHGLEDIRVSWIADNHGGDSEELTEGGSKLEVVSLEVVNVGLGENGVVLQLSSSDSWAVVGDQNELSLSRSEGLDRVFVA